MCIGMNSEWFRVFLFLYCMWQDVTEEVLADLGKVVCPRYPRASVVGGQAAEGKREGWWLVVGDPNNNSLLSIKRIALVRDTKVRSLIRSHSLAHTQYKRLECGCFWL